MKKPITAAGLVEMKINDFKKIGSAVPDFLLSEIFDNWKVSAHGRNAKSILNKRNARRGKVNFCVKIIGPFTALLGVFFQFTK